MWQLGNYPTVPLSFHVFPFPLTLYQQSQRSPIYSYFEMVTFQNHRALLIWTRYYPFNNRILVSWNSFLQRMLQQTDCSLRHLSRRSTEILSKGTYHPRVCIVCTQEVSRHYSQYLLVVNCTSSLWLEKQKSGYEFVR